MDKILDLKTFTDKGVNFKVIEENITPIVLIILFWEGLRSHFANGKKDCDFEPNSFLVINKEENVL